MSFKGKKRVSSEPSRHVGEERSRKKRVVEDIPGEDLFFDDGEAQQANLESEEEEEVEETGEQKRLRLAKEYLEQLKADVEEGEQGSDEGEEDVRAIIAKKLKQETDESKYWLDRTLAGKVSFPDSGVIADPVWSKTAGRLAVADISVTSDDATIYSVAKCGAIYKMDVETGARKKLGFGPKGPKKFKLKGTRADWVKAPSAKVPKSSFISVAVSSDGHFLAIGGGDMQIHIFDLRTEQYLDALSGHRDAVSSLTFREGTHELYSASFDRTVKSWSLDDMGYIDTLFGHQSEVLSIDMLRQERAISSGADRTCRLWKIEESTQLVFRSPGMATDSIKYLNPGTFVSGSQSDLHLWVQSKKKPVFTAERAHGNPEGGPGMIDEIEASWIQSLATCRGADVLVSGAGDGLIRMWEVQRSGGDRFEGLKQIGGLGARGFVNGLHISKDARVVIAGVGAEPRVGRWSIDKQAKSRVLVHRVEVQE
ncbi:hypothetical protein BSKO_06039 [Bryopsis sp. KO-2023]|nr:hypothetical protein BSKO_06039 [Bryopsis sp. KO-2023]